MTLKDPFNTVCRLFLCISCCLCWEIIRMQFRWEDLELELNDTKSILRHEKQNLRKSVSLRGRNIFETNEAKFGHNSVYNSRNENWYGKLLKKSHVLRTLNKLIFNSLQNKFFCFNFFSLFFFFFFHENSMFYSIM